MAINDLAVRREVILPVDRETAWAALADPAELATWLANEVDLEIEAGAQGWVRWEDGERHPATVEEVVAVLAHPDQNAIVNLIGLGITERPTFFLSLLPRLQELRRQEFLLHRGR